MKVSFDGLRKHIAADFNRVADETIYQGRREEKSLLRLKELLNDLRGSIGGLLACYDRDQMPDDFNDLSGEIKLLEL